MENQSVLSKIKNGLIVSCQADVGEPLDRPKIMASFAKAAVVGGAVAIRAERPHNIKAIKRSVFVPVIGIFKQSYPNSEVYITPTINEALAVLKADADIIALDATLRRRPHGDDLPKIIATLRQHKDVSLMADISTLEEGLAAARMGFDLIATTLSGYTAYTQNKALDEMPDFELISQLVQHLPNVPIIAEGKIWQPEQAVEALRRGAFAVVVGTAITRPKAITQRFHDAIAQFHRLQNAQTISMIWNDKKATSGLDTNQKKFFIAQKAKHYLDEAAAEFVTIKNPDYIYPPYELCPLAPKILIPVKRLSAAVMDMDGTTTTTETLCIHSLEYMVRQITSRLLPQEWQGLDAVADYPHIIGNSTTKHVEYLIETYQKYIQPEALKRAYFYAAVWFLLSGKDKKRIQEVQQNLSHLGCHELLQDERFRTTQASQVKDDSALIPYLLDRYGDGFHAVSFSDRVRAGIDIYYQRYHEILSLIQQGKGEELSSQLLGRTNAHLIEPMPGVGVFLALVKGWLGDEIIPLFPLICEEYSRRDTESVKQLNLHEIQAKLLQLSRRFQQQPLKIAVVTSSILYEAKIVMTELFRVLSKQIESWQISDSAKKMILEKFVNYNNIYDGFVTASDSHEIRLKPHRDLYNIALHQLGIPKEIFHEVIGFEDSESGTIAIRTAGIGLCIAVPFSDTQHHDLLAASFILKGGLPEALLKYNLFIRI